MDRDRLIELREETEQKLKSSELGKHPRATDLDDRFDSSNRELERILIGDISDWVGQFYRARYRAWRDGDRDTPPCRCDNPRCTLKRGELPYKLRRRQSQIRDGETSGRRVLTEYLDSHPDAVLIDEALDQQEELASEIGREMRDIQRAIDQAVDDVVNDNVETVSIF